jgi:hypothetical protein
MDAATRLVDAVVDKDKITDVEEMIGYRDPIIVPVHRAEGGNAIPVAYAHRLGDQFGLPVTEDIFQSNKPGRTNTGALHRMLNRSTFDGPVTPGQDYLLVDDNVTLGGTLSDLRSYIESKGGHVIGATTLTGIRGGEILAPTKETLDALRTKFPTLEPWWWKNHGHGLDSLTEGEADYLLGRGSVEGIQNDLSPRTGPAGTGEPSPTKD